MTLQGIFVDDQQTEAAYADNLSLAGVLEIEFLHAGPGVDIAHAIASKSPSIILIDYRLDEGGPNGEEGAQYKGSGLAQILRDRAIEKPEIDCPLVLLSAEGKIKSLYRPDKTAHDLFDRVYVKSAVNDERDRIRAELIALSEGYATLRGCNGAYPLLELVGLPADQDWVLDFQQLRVALSEAKSPHIVARVLLRDLIDRDGPLISDNEAAAFLGISIASLDLIAAVLTDTQICYAGLFSGIGRRWWAHRLHQWAKDKIGAEPAGVSSHDRATKLSSETGIPLQPAVSPWTNTGEELIAFSCFLCGRGTELKHSVSAFDPDRPKFSRPRRICWDCIQLDKHINAEPPALVDDNDASLVGEIPGMARPNAESSSDD